MTSGLVCRFGVYNEKKVRRAKILVAEDFMGVDVFSVYYSLQLFELPEMLKYAYSRIDDSGYNLARCRASRATLLAKVLCFLTTFSLSLFPKLL